MDATDIARSVFLDDGFCELLVYALVVDEAAAFVYDFGLGCVRDRIMQRRPEHLQAKHAYERAVRCHRRKESCKLDE